MNQQYLIPANSKRSMLIFGLFTPIDLIIVGVGATITFALMLSISSNTMKEMLTIITPLLISGIMVMPVPNHRNIWQLSANIYHYISNRRKYYWRGWCVIDEKEN